MIRKFGLWCAVLTLVALLGFATDATAQRESGSSSEAAAPSEANPDGEEGGEGESSTQQRRRRFVTTTSAELKLGEKSISMVTGIQKADSPDYEAISKLKDGDVLLLTMSQTIKLKTDVPLSFGAVTLKTENVAKGYAGVYGIWLRKTADGWNLIFNERPDVWGTMYDPAADVAEVSVAHKSLSEPTDALKFELPQDGQGGTLRIAWGEHEWTAPFTLAN